MTQKILKVVHIITRFIRGGADENTLLSCNSFAQNGHDVTLIHGREHSEAMLHKLHPGVLTICIDSLRRSVDPWADASALFRLRRILRRLEPDVLHTHTSKAGVLGRAAAIGLRKTVVVQGIHILPFVNVGAVERAVYLGLERALVPFTQKYVSVSSGMRDTAISHGIGPPDAHELVWSGMNLAEFTRLRDAAVKRPKAAIGNRRYRVLYLANYERRKQHRELIEVIAAERERFADTTFLFAGHGTGQAALDTLTLHHALSDTISIVGFVDEPSKVIATADICLYCSAREGLPRALVQYCAAGRPIVTFDLPGLDAIVRPGVNGLVYAQGDFRGLLAGVRQLLDDSVLREDMAAAAASAPIDSWSAEHMYDRLQAVYWDAIQAKHSR
jgi:glycosyltransferase involved in cell wall biosynthesis